MRTLITCLSVLVAFVVATPSVKADPAWDNKGWVKLGERTVNGKVDRDVIEVGKYEGTFTKVTLVVEKSALKLDDFSITFGNGEKWTPAVKHWFKDGSRTRVLDLPGDKRVIKTIHLKYENVKDYKGDAKVEVWGWKAGEAPAVIKEKRNEFDPTGWRLLGERTVNGKYDHDRITVGQYKGKFEKMAIVVLDNDLELIDLEVKFGQGAPWHPEIKTYFKADTRSRVIDFPGDERILKFIDFKYANAGKGAPAKVRVYAK